MESLGSHYIDSAIFEFGRQKRLGERALAQVLREEELEKMLDSESNSIGMIVRHLSGNMRSRWTDFLTTDGEKPNRNRNAEFYTDIKMMREQLLGIWESGWQCLFNALNSLKEDDLLAEVSIRGERMTVMQAINRQLSHYGYHVGQIVFLAKHFANVEWKSLSIPRTHLRKP